MELIDTDMNEENKEGVTMEDNNDDNDNDNINKCNITVILTIIISLLFLFSIPLIMLIFFDKNDKTIEEQYKCVIEAEYFTEEPNEEITLVNKIGLEGISFKMYVNGTFIKDLNDCQYNFSQSGIHNVILKTNQSISLLYFFSRIPNLKKIKKFKATPYEKYASFFIAMCNELESADLSELNATNISKMISMFIFNNKLKYIKFGKLFDTSQVTSMSNMFGSNKLLNNLDLSMFNTSKVRYMDYMFENCESIETLNLSSFHTNNIKSLSYLIQNAVNLKKLDLRNFNTSGLDESIISTIYERAGNLTTVCLHEKDNELLYNMTIKKHIKIEC